MNSMKKILLLLLPIVLCACISKPTPIAKTLEPNPVINSEAAQPTPIPEKTTTKPTTNKPTTTKPTTDTKPDPKTDDMTEELDSLIDDMISGL
jgi:hypothetical protein